MNKVFEIEEFLSACLGKGTILDVRSPKEFEQGHIPGAVSFPLFSNEERAEVGTIYKKIGKDKAIEKGLEIVGPKLAGFVVEAKKLSVNNTVYVYCWRGGMRSGSITWLLEMSGLNVFRLTGGYKSFRNHVLNSFNNQQKLLVLGGKTGSGKTIVLEELYKLGASVLNLEKLAHHKGSAFGAIGEKPQPTQEQFENEVFAQLQTFNSNKPVWVEDESRLIGKNIIPLGLWEQMRNSPILYLELPIEERANYLVEEYGKYGKEALVSSVEKITARLGSEQAKESIKAIYNNDLKTACINTLRYYDKTYLHGLNKRENKNVFKLEFEKFNLNNICKTLLEKEKEIYERI